MRRPMIVGNWKMNTTLDEAIELTGSILPEIEDVKRIDRVICPPFISLATIRRMLEKSSVDLGAQNLFYEEKGAYTGEISPNMLARLCQFVIIGHSERRQYFNETNAIVNKKIKAAINIGLKPILCVGENLEDNENGRTKEIINRQLISALSEIMAPGEMTIAYEPIWAIGTGKAATGQRANDVAVIIRRIINRQFSREEAQYIRILYGGSVNADNIVEFVSQAEIDGALVGGASLKPDQFTSIVRQTAEIKSE